ncbi:murein transglycosylase domain-containing protein [Thiopseudomonas acetoxidans]|uniref:Murein transglycosylase domain-containing protein n=1 Tax=Thiopseudomonas acetoxidans TaxID=3041622 RepID=A0ABT7SMN1_9GAMM|nr:murein transglycosylase domain-containing protein [Thiopseudomonas sp. CY1220]MDM7857416.1 murein transglycosylase domain-containing protein [Thiopseudomonas sp. CY1220]
MNRRQLLQLLALSPLVTLVACKPQQVRRSVDVGRRVAQGELKGAIGSQIPSTGIPEVDRLVRGQLEQLANKLAKKWGDKRVASKTEYVKYSDKYQTRAVVNFDTGVIRVETIEKKDAKAKLEQAIISTLLAPSDPSGVDLLSDKAVNIGAEPFLHGLVVDHQGQAIRYEWRAGQYAKHLLANAYQQDKYKGKTRYFVSFAMVQNHHANSQHKYASYVAQNSRRFKVKSSLIYAIMEAESSFNPYAISHVPAYGLMQIVPTTAGRDAHQLIYNRPGTPSKDYLFMPQNNIQMGAAYLSILNDRYLARVTHPLSREYCVIAGYNTGSGNVLKAFHSNRDQAFAQINRLSPAQVYNQLVAKLPYAETRRYLPKVTQYQRKYS